MIRLTDAINVKTDIPAPEADKHDHTLRSLCSTRGQHGDFKGKEREPVSTLDSLRGVADG